MSRKPLKVYVTDSILLSIKKKALSEGKSISEIGRELIEFAITNRFESGEEPVSAPALEAVMDVMKSVGSGVPPEALRFLIADVAKTENLLRQISRLLSEKGPGNPAQNYKIHEERVRIAEQKSDRILKKLKLEEVEDVDRFEMKVSTKEETKQILKEMGIGVEGSK